MPPKTDKSATERTFECMKQAYDCGINFFDTAERYFRVVSFLFRFYICGPILDISDRLTDWEVMLEDSLKS
jgi:hypothetical protein